jgi:hypothetical protein
LVAAARQAQSSGASWDRAAQGMRPFPFEAKQEIYRHFLSEAKRISPDTPVTLCAETRRMWDALDGLADGKPWNYVCNCGPHCAPGLRAIERVEGPDAERIVAAAAANRPHGAAMPGQ